MVLFLSMTLHAQEQTTITTTNPNTDSDHSAPAPDHAEVVNTRIFGVLPNYRTTDGRLEFSPITAGQKMSIAAKDSFDWPVYFITGAYSLIYQAENQNPTFGQGMAGFAKRYGATYADMAIGNIVAEGFLPVLLHEDPRYFRKGEGSTSSRVGNAVKQILVGRKDSGAWGFNFSEVLGGMAATGISNLYYPDSRTASDNLERFAFQIGNDAISNVLKEFWPDIKHKLFDHQHETRTSPQPFVTIEKQP
jgi:hypothetical protein